MKRVLLLKRGSTPVVSTYRGPAGELVYDKGLQTLRIQDGIKTGGFRVYTEADADFRPSIVSPANGALNVSRQMTLTATPYGGSGTHGKSRWMVYLNPEMTELIHDSGWLEGGSNSYDYEGPTDTYIYIRVIYMTENGYTTRWSPLIVIKTNAEWLTYFTAQRETSRDTDVARTTEVITYEPGYRETWEPAVNQNTSYQTEVLHETSTYVPAYSAEQYNYFDTQTTHYSNRDTQRWTFYTSSVPAGQTSYAVANMNNTDAFKAFTYWSYDALVAHNTQTMTSTTFYYPAGYRNTDESEFFSINRSTELVAAHNTQTYDPLLANTTEWSTEFESLTYFMTDAETSRYTS